MTLSTYRNSPYWKAAIDLGPALARLADDLPATETYGLSAALRKYSIALPAAIAADLLAGHTTTRYPVTLKLQAALELVDRVYPALDTAAVRAAADTLAEQLLADDFGASDDVPAPAARFGAGPAPVQPAPLPPAPAPAPATVPINVPVTGDEPQLQPASPLGAAPMPVSAAPVQESHVQPDSQE
ncbi:MAG TPA: hypothetical protein VI322_00440 [Candidatus Saccharimonadia bacterium]